MKLCETCSSWTDDESWLAKAAGLRKCSAVRQLWDIEDDVPDAILEGKYQDDTGGIGAKYRAATEAAFAKAKAAVNDASQYRAALLTRPDFGCVLHTDKT